MYSKMISTLFLHFQPSSDAAKRILLEISEYDLNPQQILERLAREKRTNGETYALWVIANLRFNRNVVHESPRLKSVLPPGIFDLVSVLQLMVQKKHLEAFKSASESILKTNRPDIFLARFYMACVEHVNFNSYLKTHEDVMNRVLKTREAVSGAELAGPIERLLRHSSVVTAILDSPCEDELVLNDLQLLNKHPVFIEILRIEPVGSIFWETLIAKILYTVSRHPHDTYQNAFYDLIDSLLCVNFLNGGIYITPAIRQNFEIHWLNHEDSVIAAVGERFLESSALSLPNFPNLRRFRAFCELLRLWHFELPATEMHFKGISSNRAEDDKVETQYRESPYPVWLQPTISITPKTIAILRSSLNIKEESRGKSHIDRVLVAGCGTGRQVVALATEYPEASITAIDVSTGSLAYAELFCRKAGIINAHFCCVDLNQSLEIRSQFDYIECGGVLHHLLNPTQTLKELVNLMHDSGIIRIGLYSQTARQYLYDFKREFKPNPDLFEADWQEIRQHAVKSRYSSRFAQCRDFYSKTEFRDLVFNQRERAYTVTDLETLLHDTGLRFLKMRTPSIASRLGVSSTPQTLEEWGQAEVEYPELFTGMYDFFACKTNARDIMSQVSNN